MKFAQFERTGVVGRYVAGAMWEHGYRQVLSYGPDILPLTNSRPSMLAEVKICASTDIFRHLDIAPPPFDARNLQNPSDALS